MDNSKWSSSHTEIAESLLEMPEAAKLSGAALRSVYAISSPIKLKGATQVQSFRLTETNSGSEC